MLKFVDDARHQIEKNDKNVKQTGVMSFIPRFALLATRMEQYIQGQSRDSVDQAYIKIIGVMFLTLDKISQADLKHSNIFLLENYASFQNSLYDLANCVPTLAKFYHQASESYEQSCARHICVIIYYQFERLFQFAQRIEDMMVTNSPEEIQFQVGLSKSDLRKVVKSSLSGKKRCENSNLKPPLPNSSASQFRKGTYHESLDFVHSLCETSYGLEDVFPVEDRKSALCESLTEINVQVAATQSSGGLSLSSTHTHSNP